MSTLAAITEAASVATLPQANDLLGFAGEKINAVGVLFKGLAAVLAVFFVLRTALKSGGAMAAIVIAGLCAGLFVWLVRNVGEVETRFDNEINARPALVHVVAQDG